MATTTTTTRMTTAADAATMVVPMYPPTTLASATPATEAASEFTTGLKKGRRPAPLSHSVGVSKGSSINPPNQTKFKVTTTIRPFPNVSIEDVGSDATATVANSGAKTSEMGAAATAAPPQKLATIDIHAQTSMVVDISQGAPDLSYLRREPNRKFRPCPGGCNNKNTKVLSLRDILPQTNPADLFVPVAEHAARQEQRLQQQLQQQLLLQQQYQQQQLILPRLMNQSLEVAHEEPIPSEITTAADMAAAAVSNNSSAPGMEVFSDPAPLQCGMWPQERDFLEDPSANSGVLDLGWHNIQTDFSPMSPSGFEAPSQLMPLPGEFDLHQPEQPPMLPHLDALIAPQLPPSPSLPPPPPPPPTTAMVVTDGSPEEVQVIPPPQHQQQIAIANATSALSALVNHNREQIVSLSTLFDANSGEMVIEDVDPNSALANATYIDFGSGCYGALKHVKTRAYAVRQAKKQVNDGKMIGNARFLNRNTIIIQLVDPRDIPETPKTLPPPPRPHLAIENADRSNAAVGAAAPAPAPARRAPKKNAAAMAATAAAVAALSTPLPKCHKVPTAVSGMFPRCVVLTKEMASSLLAKYPGASLTHSVDAQFWYDECKLQTGLLAYEFAFENADRNAQRAAFFFGDLHKICPSAELRNQMKLLGFAVPEFV